MPRYVILRHELPPTAGRPSHWDFMLEEEGALRTWAVEKSPDGEEPQTALQLADHRLAYLTYEGEVSGGRGRVTRWDEGSYDWLHRAADTVCVSLKGKRLRGEVRLQQSADDPQRWDFAFSSA